MRFKNEKGNGKYLKHYGMPRRSGRYPWGSGKKPQRNKNIYNVYRQLHKEGFSDNEIAAQWDISVNRLKAIKSIGRDEERRLKVERAEKLKAKGYSNMEIGRRMGIRESSVRSLLDEARKERTNKTRDTANIVKAFVDEHKYVDIGKGTEIALDIKPSRMQSVIEQLRAEGYSTHSVFMNQMGTNYQTEIKCLVAPGVSKKELFDHKFDIVPVSDVVIDTDGLKIPKREPINNIDASRVGVRYAEEGGVEKDGLIEIRRGCADLNLGQAAYAQVRIGIAGTHYAKGMCIYGDDKDFPPGVDILVNSNKKKGTPLLGERNDGSVLKLQKDDPNNPFGASIKEEDKLRMVQKYYDDPVTGEKKVSALNIVNEEGNWSDWKRSLSSQFLSKQRVQLAKEQLDQKYTASKDEFDEICKLTNPTLKRVLLEKFADGCDAAAVDLKGAALPGQASHVLIPCPSLKPNEIYAPNYENGTNVVLVRYPHASVTEIPQLVVNNNNKEARKMLGLHPTDAVAINPAAAQQMSGADFDGDSALVIPANNVGGKVRIKTGKQFEALKEFDPGIYKLERDENGELVHPEKLMSERMKQKQMGVVSNLITDMTLKGADEDHMVRAIKHSMVVIDAVKHEYDWKKSEQDNDIDELKRLYQKRIDPVTGEEKYGGAGTIVSRAKSKYEVPERKAITGIAPYRIDENGKEVGNTDPETGKIINRNTDASYMYISEKTSTGKTKKLTVFTDYKTGEQYTVDPATKERKYRSPEEVEAKAKIKGRTQWTTKMAEAEDAYKLTSGGSKENPGHPMEGVYADYANKQKALANLARKTYLETPPMRQDKEARQKYDEEYKDLTKQLLVAKSNAPRERRATILANKEIAELKEREPDIDNEHLKKAKGNAINRARLAVGAKKTKIEISEKGWEAIQAGCFSDSTLKDILNNTDIDKVRQYAMPRQAKNTVSSTKKARIKAMSSSYTTKQIAEMLGVSTSTVSDVLNGKDK